ncbi:MAG: permease [Candidatus Aminicenantes bacterium]|nr:permease [Candidatus Aminicenantes bacterium]
MLIPTVIMAALAVVALLLGYFGGEGQHLKGLKVSFKMTIEILPLLIFAFILAGMVQVLLPEAQISRWIGAESGIRGLLVGTLAGGITPGGPYVSLPLAAGLLRAGAGFGTMVAFMTAWSLWAVGRIPMEVGILGWKFTFIRLACTFFFPPIAGFIAETLFSGMK